MDDAIKCSNHLQDTYGVGYNEHTPSQVCRRTPMSESNLTLTNNFIDVVYYRDTKFRDTLKATLFKIALGSLELSVDMINIPQHRAIITQLFLIETSGSADVSVTQANIQLAKFINDAINDKLANCNYSRDLARALAFKAGGRHLLSKTQLKDFNIE